MSGTVLAVLTTLRAQRKSWISQHFLWREVLLHFIQSILKPHCPKVEASQQREEAALGVSPMTYQFPRLQE